MNQKEIAEIRRRLAPEKSAIGNIRGCYVNEKREIVSLFNREMISLPEGEMQKYLGLFRRTLSGVPGKNLVDVNFRPDQVTDGEAHHLLYNLRNTGMQSDEDAENLFVKIIESLEIEGNYLILLTYDAYDVPFRAKDEYKVEDASEEVFRYILCTICPVKQSRPALRYMEEDNDFHDREQDWVVGAPEVGFMFPEYEDGGANIYKALVYSKDTADMHDGFIGSVFDTSVPMPADTQKQTFQTMLEETLGEDLSLEVVQTVREQLCERIEEHKKDKEADPLLVTKGEVALMLEECGVSEEHVAAFNERYDNDLGTFAELSPRNIVDEKAFVMKTPDVVIRVNPERSDLVQTRIIDGSRYILIRADDGVEVNGVNIRIGQSEE